MTKKSLQESNYVENKKKTAVKVLWRTYKLAKPMLLEEEKKIIELKKMLYG